MILIFLAGKPLKAEPLNVVYFDPDGNLRKIAAIRALGNQYFKKIHRKVNFIVVGKSKTLKRKINTIKPQIMIVHSLYYTEARYQLSLKPLCIFTRNGSLTYRKKVITFDKSIKSLPHIRNKVIASSPFGNYIYTLLGQNRIPFKTLTVPKDLDALLALKFKQANAALVSETNLVSFSKKFPADYRKMNVIFTTRGIRLPIVVSTKYNKNKKFTADVKRLLLRMKKDPDGRKLLKIMNFDGIKKF
ncbi:MAG: phosphate/phosphite/phosphonate ABC transporter substrate-binding protein [bacterium]|nr:phosphate/phosphite/phosphonate ABC transporter substrate-binding protein [bacterium]